MWITVQMELVPIGQYQALFQSKTDKTQYVSVEAVAWCLQHDLNAEGVIAGHRMTLAITDGTQVKTIQEALEVELKTFNFVKLVDTRVAERIKTQESEVPEASKRNGRGPSANRVIQTENPSI